jgi:hypothetical protein
MAGLELVIVGSPYLLIYQKSCELKFLRFLPTLLPFPIILLGLLKAAMRAADTAKLELTVVLDIADSIRSIINVVDMLSDLRIS